jgi:hypothetical protein
MKNQLLLLCLVYGLSGGLVYLNPTEPFNLYLEVGFVAGLSWPLHSCSINCGCSWLPGTGAEQPLSSLPTLVSCDVEIQTAGCDL